MGAKTSIIIQSTDSPIETLSNSPVLDRKRSLEIAESLFPEYILKPVNDESLSSVYPADDILLVGNFGDTTVIIARELACDKPSEMYPGYILDSGTTTLHCSHSYSDWFAFGHWVDGKLRRSLSISSEDATMEDEGERMGFEKPYWDGEFPLFEEGEEEEAADYPFIFHPIDLGDAAMLYFLGFEVEGNEAKINPYNIALLCFKFIDRPEGEDCPPQSETITYPNQNSDSKTSKKSWWKFWH